MHPKQSVFRIRRRYNQWVNNQTLEDYALRYTATKARRFSFSRLANTALGSISFLALEAIGAALTLNYGFYHAALAIGAVSLLIFLVAIPICITAARTGLDIDLLTRGAGFGYLGSTFTSLIYASFTFIFFALETAIMAQALNALTGLPLSIGYILCSLAIIPLVTHGITFISRFQSRTQIPWLLIQLMPVVFLCYLLSQNATLPHQWVNFTSDSLSLPDDGFSLPLFGAASAVVFALIAQIGEQVDYLRFMPLYQREKRWQWWATLLASGPGWIIIGAIKMFIGSFLAVFLLTQGFTLAEAQDPTRMYAAVFGEWIPWDDLSIILAACFVILAQVKINVTNAYAGSIAWSNFFSRLTHNHPGRVVWLVFNVVIALVLMELGIYRALENILSVYALVAVAWFGALVGDLTINKPLGLSPKRIDFIRAYLPKFNPVGLGSMLCSFAIGLLCYTGALGDMAKALAHFITLLCAFWMMPALAKLTHARFYCARQPEPHSDLTALQRCCICENHFDAPDMAYCPLYAGAICSLCCSLDARCLDGCKPEDKDIERLWQRLLSQLPENIQHYLTTKTLQFLALMLTSSCLSGGVLGLIFLHESQASVTSLVTPASLAPLLIQIFFVFQILLGIIAWLFVLTNDSRKVAIEETRIQTQRLLDEIDAHKITDQKLKSAKELAESANNAKSRYLTGLSHELRTPMNAIMGYTQLLYQDHQLTDRQQHYLSIIKHSGEHLTDLIEGLLDLSKIEAGRLDLHRNRVAISELIHQLADIFKRQAQAKGLHFSLQLINPLPKLVAVDEKRLRQILTNLLSNAVKYTHQGGVEWTVRYRNQVAEFCVRDTGVGIPKCDYERIFKPFERVRMPGQPSVHGTGLGLTITRLLVDIMGGDLRVEPNRQSWQGKPACGTVFSVSLMLSPLTTDAQLQHDKTVIGLSRFRGTHFAQNNTAVTPNNTAVAPNNTEANPSGPCVLVLDDDVFHRGLVFDSLQPLGITVYEAPDPAFARTHFDLQRVDAFILDVNLPDENGWAFARWVRQYFSQTPIIMISADANDGQKWINDSISGPFNPNTPPIATQDFPLHQGYLIKPIRLSRLFDLLASVLDIDWRYADETKDYPQAAEALIEDPSAMPPKRRMRLIMLWEAADSGDLTALRHHLFNDLSQDDVRFWQTLQTSLLPSLATLNFVEIKRLLEPLLHDAT